METFVFVITQCCPAIQSYKHAVGDLYLVTAVVWWDRANYHQFNSVLQPPSKGGQIVSTKKSQTQSLEDTKEVADTKEVEDPVPEDTKEVADKKEEPPLSHIPKMLVDQNNLWTVYNCKSAWEMYICITNCKNLDNKHTLVNIHLK